KEGRGSSQVARPIDGVANAADFFGRADLHGAFRHMRRRPELILVAIGIGEIDDGAFIAFRGCLHRIGVWDFMLIERPQVEIDILGTDVEAAARQLLAQRFRWRVNLGLEEGADTARSAFPPQEASYLDVSFSRRSGEADERSSGNACSIYCPVSPYDH